MYHLQALTPNIKQGNWKETSVGGRGFEYNGVGDLSQTLTLVLAKRISLAFLC